MRSSLFARNVPTHFAALIVLVTATVGTALALDYSSASAERLSVSAHPIAPTDFSVTDVHTEFRGFNRIDVAFVLSNRDASAAHTANVTAQFVDASGNFLVQKSVVVSVPPGERVTAKVTVGKAGVVRSFFETLFVIQQDS